MLPQEFRVPIAIFVRQCHLVNPRSLKREELIATILNDVEYVQCILSCCVIVTSSTASPSTSKPKRNRKAPDYFVLKKSGCSISEDSAPAPKRQKASNPVIETVIQEEALQPPAIETSIELSVVSPPPPPPVEWSPEEYDYNEYAREISLSVFDAENQI